MSDNKNITPIWSRGINFKVYGLDNKIKYDVLLKNLKHYRGDVLQQKEGWLTDNPYLKTEDENIASFIYTRFRRDAGASRVEGHDVYVPESISCNFHFEEKLIIVSTANDSKLNYLVEKKIFDTIRSLTDPYGCNYKPDFLFWLAYKYDIDGKKITNDIKVTDITAISSEREKFNLTDAVTANTEVTNHIEAKILLALYGFANGARLKINMNKKDYNLKLSADGRISATPGVNIDTKEDKALYALNIHHIIQKCYEEYSKDKKLEWDNNKKNYRQSLLKDIVKSLSSLFEDFDESTE